jgi:hypothetical protein
MIYTRHALLSRDTTIMRGRDFAELTAFIAVAETQSFVRAASRLSVSRSALSGIEENPPLLAAAQSLDNKLAAFVAEATDSASDWVAIPGAWHREGTWLPANYWTSKPVFSICRLAIQHRTFTRNQTGHQSLYKFGSRGQGVLSTQSGRHELQPPLVEKIKDCPFSFCPGLHWPQQAASCTPGTFRPGALSSAGRSRCGGFRALRGWSRRCSSSSLKSGARVTHPPVSYVA